ncbi:MAG: NAD(P)/FAD-dependent oxidoreductase [Thalassovita sp.]
MTSEHSHILWRNSDQQEAHYAPLAQPLSVDLLIIGGGFTGCAAALEAARSGASVALVEANTIGHGGSGRNVGLVNAGLWLPPDSIVKKLGPSAGEKLIDCLSGAPDAVFKNVADLGINCEATRNGTLHLAHAPRGMKDLRKRFQQGNRFGAPLQLLDAAQTKERTGSDAFHGALFDPRAGTVQPLAYCRGLASEAARLGAQIFTQSKVSKLTRANGTWLAEVNGHQISAKHVLQATNAYAEGLSNIPKAAFVPVSFSQFATEPLTEAQRVNILPGGEGCWDTGLVMSSIRIDAEGRLVIGGLGNAKGAGAIVHEAWARRKLAFFYPELADVAFAHCWTGDIAMTSDHIPKVVRIGPSALSVFGYSGRGIGPGTVFGQSAARALLFGETNSLPVEICETHTESFASLRAAYYECGTIVTHAVSPNPLKTNRTGHTA